MPSLHCFPSCITASCRLFSALGCTWVLEAYTSRLPKNCLFPTSVFRGYTCQLLSPCHAHGFLPVYLFKLLYMTWISSQGHVFLWCFTRADPMFHHLLEKHVESVQQANVSQIPVEAWQITLCFGGGWTGLKNCLKSDTDRLPRTTPDYILSNQILLFFCSFGHFKTASIIYLFSTPTSLHLLSENSNQNNLDQYNRATGKTNVHFWFGGGLSL